MKLLTFRYLLVALTFVSSACNTDDPESSASDRGTVVSSADVGSLTKDQVVAAITEFPAQSIAANDVTLHTITYSTQVDGKPVDSRGLLILPKGVASPPLLAYFHGTLLPLPDLMKVETPSLYTGGNENFREVRTMGLAFATAGYATFLPDYIGYGLTAGQDHPYINYAEMFVSNIDGLLAARAFMTSKGIPDDKRLFLTGWSQGGGACLSAHKYIQEQYADRFTVVASSSLAGPFNVNRFVNTVLEKDKEEQGITFVTSWALYALNKFSGIKRPTDQIWTYPVPNQAAAILTPSKIPNQVFKEAFIAGIRQGTDRAFVDLLKSNSVHEGWKPVGKVFLHHGESDDVVPYFNSTDAVTGLKAQGGDVSLYSYPTGEHDNKLADFVPTTIKDFGSLK